MITISEPFPIKENIYTVTISEGNDNNIRITSVKENIYTQLSSVRGVITI